MAEGRTAGEGLAKGEGRTGSEGREDRAEVVMYWRPGCGYCMKLQLQLLFARLPYQRVNIWRNPDASAFVRSVADGNATVPTVTVAGKAMVNPSLRQLLAAVEADAPHLLEEKR